MNNSQMEVLKALKAPFPDECLEWRVQSASSNNGQHRVLMLPYVDARAVMDRLDEVAGLNWKVDHEKIVLNNIEGFKATISILIDGEWVTRADGAGATDVESMKGAFSSAIKRAAVLWGVGRYLYDMKPVWMPLKKHGDIYVGGNFKINGKQERLSGYVDRPRLNQPPKNNGQQQQAQGNQQAQYKEQQQGNQKPQNTGQQQQTQQKPSNQSKTNVETAKAIQVIQGIFENLQVPVGYVSGILRRAGHDCKTLEAASFEHLQNVLKATFFANKYIDHCRSLGFGEMQALYHAQLILNVEVKEVCGLFFQMDKEKCARAIEYVNTIKAEQTA